MRSLYKGAHLRLVIATTNRGKAAEFRRLIALAGVEVVDLSALGAMEAVEETGNTFIANACLKASYYAKLGEWTLADDSGLAVDALGGKPGVHTGRWAALHDRGEGDAANNELLLEQLKNVEDGARAARFVCCLALADARGRIILTATDWVEGSIVRQARGSGGFGYDPLFFVESHRMTTAEMPPGEKDAISHRGKAMRRMKAAMERIGFGSDVFALQANGAE